MNPQRLKQLLCVGAGAVIFGLAALFLVGVLEAQAQPGSPSQVASNDPSVSVWHDRAEPAMKATDGERVIVPTAYRFLQLDFLSMRSLLVQAPLETAVNKGNTTIALPRPDGSFERFTLDEAPIMAPELASKYPDIRTYVGQGIDDPTATLRLDITPLGFHAQILAEGSAWYIDPWRRGDIEYYQSYFHENLARADGRPEFVCLVQDADGALHRTQMEADNLTPHHADQSRPNGGTLRTYRLVVAATGEYSTKVCSPNPAAVACAMAAINTSVNRVVGIYERELSVRMVLVANNNLVVYTNGATDPYTNNDGYAMLGENQTTIDSLIGTANYDVGHVFSTGGGGIAAVGVPCLGGAKAEGVTGSSNPIGDGFDVDYVAHEMGHQFGAMHTFNGTTSNCGGVNRSASSAYEPGSGSTIMAYAGICGAEDLQPNSDPYFHSRSYDQILAYTIDGSGDSCPVKTATGNSAPTVNPGASYNVPMQTPFTLTGSATDPNGDALTYCWEEYDLGTAAPPNDDVAAARPIFRSFNPTSSPSRTFPRLLDIRTGTPTLGESMSTRTRTMTFRLTARDNKAAGGGVEYASTTASVTSTAGPFTVTQPTTGTSWAGGSCQTVTWNVASTTAAPVSCANVDILFSTDDGVTFPTTLLAATPNDGTQALNLPTVTSATARIKVACSNNIFFNMSRAFTITASPGTYTTTVTKTGRGSGTVSSAPAGINCGATCSFAFSRNACVTLTATPSLGSTFTGWSGACGGTGVCQLTMDAAKAVTANFNWTSTPTGYYPVTPCRVFDTREVTGPTVGAPIGASTSQLFNVVSTCGIPAGAIAIVGNLTVVNAVVAGEMEVIAGNNSTTATSTISIPVSRARANNAVVGLATNGAGSILAINRATGTVHLILDVSGYFL